MGLDRLSEAARASLARLFPTEYPPEPEEPEPEPEQSTLPASAPEPAGPTPFDVETRRPRLLSPAEQVDAQIQRLRVSQQPHGILSRPMPAEQPRMREPERERRKVVGATPAERTGDYMDHVLNDVAFSRIEGISDEEKRDMHVATETARVRKLQADKAWLDRQQYIRELEHIIESEPTPSYVGPMSQVVWTSDHKRKKHTEKVRWAKRELKALLGDAYELPLTGLEDQPKPKRVPGIEYDQPEIVIDV